jgi:hypothetical protein
MQDALEEKLGAIECERGNMEVQWNNIQKCVLVIVNDLIWKVRRRENRPRITHEVVSKMDARRKWKNVNK